LGLGLNLSQLIKKCVFFFKDFLACCAYVAPRIRFTYTVIIHVFRVEELKWVGILGFSIDLDARAIGYLF